MDLSSYVDKAFRVVSDPALLRSRLEEYGGILESLLKKHGEVLSLGDKASYVFVGDLHGNIDDLKKVLRHFGEDRLRSGDLKLIFLGDYIDRGGNQLEVLTALLELKAEYPESVILLKGNHEGVDVVEPSPHDFPEELISRYLIGEGLRIYEAIVEKVFMKLPLAVYLRDHFLALHGGLPTATFRKAQDLRSYLLGSQTEPLRDVVVEVLWNDPIESNDEAYPSPRGAGMLFGRPVTEWVTRNFNIKLVVRGHEPCAKGYKFNHGGRVLTLFSRIGPPYYNSMGAFLEVNTAEEDWYRLVKSAQSFKFIRPDSQDHH